MKTFISLATASMLLGCMPDSAQDLKRSEIPATHLDTASLGRAYSTMRKKVLNVQCATGDTEERGNTTSQLNYEKDMSFDRLLNTIGGELGVSVKFPVVSAGASAQLAKEWASQKLNETHTFHWIASPKKQVLREGSLRLTDKGEYYQKAFNSSLAEKCGEEFVTEIHRGASILGIIKMDFLNEEDKFKVSGKLNVDVMNGIVKVDGSLQYVDEKVKQRTKLTVTAVQNGGTPERLAKILPDNLVFCSLANPEPCLQTMANLMKYAKEDFQEQLKDPAHYNAIKFVTERYDESGLESLVPSVGYKAMEAEVKSYLEFTLETLIRKTMLDAERAFRLRTFSAEALSSDQVGEIEVIERAALHNSRVLMDISAYCYDQGGLGCLDYRDKQIKLIEPYDAKKLEIDPSSLKESISVCNQALAYARDRGWISTSQYEAFKRRGWAPIFNDARDWSKGIKGEGPCGETGL